MSVPYQIRKFRDTDSPVERKRIYQKVGNKLKARIRKRFHLCIQCFERPNLEGFHHGPSARLCRQCFRAQDAKAQRKERFIEGMERARLTPHVRVCIGCQSLFTSNRGHNMCLLCIQREQQLAADRTLERTAESIGRRELLPSLYHRYGHSYKSSLTPRIPLSSVGVFDSLPPERSR